MVKLNVEGSTRILFLLARYSDSEPKCYLAEKENTLGPLAHPNQAQPPPTPAPPTTSHARPPTPTTSHAHDLPHPRPPSAMKLIPTCFSRSTITSSSVTKTNTGNVISRSVAYLPNLPTTMRLGFEPQSGSVSNKVQCSAKATCRSKLSVETNPEYRRPESTVGNG